MRFFCDEMLGGLGRWLRAAGYDTAVALPATPDRALLHAIRVEERLLLTCDRCLARRAAATAVLLASTAPDRAAPELRQRLGVDWLHAPFSRCLLDNTPLRPARIDEHDALPSTARYGAGPINVCARCGRLYWPGSHVRRMQARLEHWARLQH